jgi:hypothetical protein
MADAKVQLRNRVMAAWYRSNGIPVSETSFHAATTKMDPQAYHRLATWFDEYIDHYSGLASHTNPSDAMIQQAVTELNQGIHAVHGPTVWRDEITRLHNATAVRPGMQVLRGVGVVAGIGMIGHGLYGAVNATMSDPHTGEQKRDWRKTILRLGETAAGAGLSWVSYVAGRHSSPRIR